MRLPKLSPHIASFGARFPAGVLGDAKPIARRFAPSADVREEAPRPIPAEPPIAPLAVPEHREAVRRPGLRPLLLAALIIPALLCVIIGSLWLGVSGRTTISGASSPAAPQAEAFAVLTTLERIEATAGDRVSFPIAIDGTDGVPPGSVIGIVGLPPESSFSEGVARGNGEWSLKPDQIGDLLLALPPSAHGDFKIRVSLVAPSDKTIAQSETRLAVASGHTGAIATLEGGAAPLHAAAGEASAPVPLSAAPEPAPVAVSPGDTALSALVPPLEEPVPAAVSPGGDTAMSALVAPAAEATIAATAAVPPEAPAPETMQEADDAAAPGDGAQPSTVGHPEGGETVLDTVRPSQFVNLREAASSSAPVLAVVAKGTELSVFARKRGWVEVVDPATGKRGWVYSGILDGEAKPQRKSSRAAVPDSEPETDSFWTRMGRWLRPWKRS